MDINIIKLGGSVITCERGPGFFDRRNTLRLARELAPFSRGLVLIHGTGRVGKPPAVTHGYAADGHLAPDRRLLALHIRNDLRALNQRFVSTFLSAGVPVTPLGVEHTFDEGLTRLRSARLKSQLLKTLANGQVPVFHGDLMPQGDGGFQVFSSDLIALILARALRPSRCIFLTAVPGVYRKGAGARSIIENLDSRTLRLVDRPKSADPDVSGGMEAKIRCALAIAGHCGACHIASGRDPAILAGLLAGRAVPATKVFPAACE